MSPERQYDEVERLRQEYVDRPSPEILSKFGDTYKTYLESNYFPQDELVREARIKLKSSVRARNPNMRATLVVQRGILEKKLDIRGGDEDLVEV